MITMHAVALKGTRTNIKGSMDGEDGRKHAGGRSVKGRQ